MTETLRLFVVQPDGSTADRTFAKLPVRLGRGPENEIVLEDENASRVHAQFHLVGDQLYIRDCDSLNGIRLNGEIVLDAAVQPGDAVQIGRCQVRVLATDPEDYSDDGSSDELIVRPDGTGGVLEVIRAIDIEKLLSDGGKDDQTWPLRNPFQSEEVKAALPRLHRAYNNLLVIMNLVSKVGNYSHPDQVCEQFVTALKSVFPLVENVAIVEFSDDDPPMELIYQQGFDSGFMAKSHPSRTVLQRVSEELRAVYAVDARKDPRFVKADSVLVRGVRSMMCAPLVARGDARGALYVENLTQPYCFGQFDLNFLTVFAFHLGIALETSRLLVERDRAFERALESIKSARKDKSALLVQYSQSERKFRALFEQSALGAAVINLVSGKIEEVNEGLVRMLGFSRRQMTGMGFGNLLSGHGRTQAAEWLRHVRQHGDGSFKVRLKSSTGRLIVAILSCRALRLGESLVMAAYFIDVTAQERAEAQTRTQLIRVTALSELSQTLMTTMDTEAIYRLLFEKVLTVMALDEFLIARVSGGDHQKMEILFAARKDDNGELSINKDIPELTTKTPLVRDALERREAAVHGANLNDVRVSGGVETRRPFDFRPDKKLASVIVVPMMARPLSNGVVCVQSAEVHAFDNSHVETLQALVAQAALALSNAEAFESIRKQQESVRQLNLQILTAQETERARISRELHDGVGQQLTAMKYILETIRSAAKNNDKDKLIERIDESREFATQIIEELRSISLDLRPTMLDDLGLVPTLEWLARQYTARQEIPVELSCDLGKANLASEVSTVIYRIIQEALGNIGKHAKASKVSVALTSRAKDLHVEIEDDGVGFDTESLPSMQAADGCSGVLNMKERARFLGGDFRIESTPKIGTKVFVRIPLKENSRKNGPGT